MAQKSWQYLKLQNGDHVHFVPPAPNGDTLGGITETEKEKIDTAIQSVKTINGNNIVGEGNVEIYAGGDIEADPSDQTGLTFVPGTAASIDKTLTYDNYAADAKVVGDQLTKVVNDITSLDSTVDALPKMASTPTVGQIFQVSAVSESGAVTMVPVDMPTVPVTDVQVKNESIVSDGIAQMPIANQDSKIGLMRGSQGFGINMDMYGYLRGLSVTAANYPSADSRTFVCKGTLNNVLATPSIMPTLTADEQKAACSRAGAVYDGQFELIQSYSLTQDAYTFERTAEPNGTAYNFKCVYVRITAASYTKSQTANINFYSQNGTSKQAYITDFTRNGSTSHSFGMCLMHNSSAITFGFSGQASGSDTSKAFSTSPNQFFDFSSSFTSVGRVAIVGSSITIPSGTIIKIYAIRA